MDKWSQIAIGFPVYLGEGGARCGAVRGAVPGADALVIYVEHIGDCEVPLDAVQRVHEGKVILDVERLAVPLRHAITHAYPREDLGASSCG
jgi:hypothetical protein